MGLGTRYTSSEIDTKAIATDTMIIAARNLWVPSTAILGTTILSITYKSSWYLVL